MNQTVGTENFVELETVRHILAAVADLLPKPPSLNNNNNAAKKNKSMSAAEAQKRKAMEDDVINVGRSVMTFISSMTDDDLKKIPVDQLQPLQQDLQHIFDRLVVTRRDACYEFYEFWRNWVHKLINSPSLPLKLFGWESVNDLIDACERHRPPPRTFWVKNAGTAFANGLFDFSGAVTPDGYFQPIFLDRSNNQGAAEHIMYVHEIPQAEHPQQQAGHKLTLFRCTMRSQQKWWFLSEADEEQPGTDRDIDYYQHKSLKDQEEAYPPAAGWLTCRNAGSEPPPNLQAIGWMLPEGEERNTLEHQLAKWAISQAIVEQVLGDTTSHREVVARSTNLIQFLAKMCSREDGVWTRVPDALKEKSVDNAVNINAEMSTDTSSESAATAPTGTIPAGGAADSMNMDESSMTGETTSTPEEYCLQPRHLLFAWKTCTRKADAAVSAQVYQLLVSILPMCTPNLAIPLLKAVRASLEDPELTLEVGEFCGALADGNILSENKTAGGKKGLDESILTEIMNLLWAVLTHPEASTLKSYDNIRLLVSVSLRGDKGTQHRERFLRSCVESLTTLSLTVSGTTPAKEAQALLMVKLTYFIIEACPRSDADRMAAKDDGSFPRLVYEELKAYLLRRKTANNGGNNLRSARNASLSSLSSAAAGPGGAPDMGDNTMSGHVTALQERLRILRAMYGLSDYRSGANDTLVMSAEMLKAIWDLGSQNDRESLIVFFANCSQNGKIHSPPSTVQPAAQQQPPLDQQQRDPTILSPAMTEDVCRKVFLDLFCYTDTHFDFSTIAMQGYQSFHLLFNFVRQSSQASPSEKRAALDAQWRLCLTACETTVSKQAMRDLLAVYISAENDRRTIRNNARAAYEQRNPQSMEQDAAVSTPETPPPSWEEEAVATAASKGLDDDFGERIFQCLSQVKADIGNKAGDSAYRAAERCVRIVNAAVGQQIDSVGSYSNTPSTLSRLSNLPLEADLDTALKCLPHGLRGTSACSRVTITARRGTLQNSNPSLREGAPAQTPTNRVDFGLDVHPLETFHSMKLRIAHLVQCNPGCVKALQITGRRANAGETGTNSMNLNSIPEDTVMDELGVVDGCEMMVQIADRMQASVGLPPPQRSSQITNDLSAVFFSDDSKFSDQLFSALLELLDLLADISKKEDTNMEVDGAPNDNSSLSSDITHSIWDLLESMPTNSSIVASVSQSAGKQLTSDAMEIDSSATSDGAVSSWKQLLEASSSNKAVYVLLTIYSFLNPAEFSMSVLPNEQRSIFQTRMRESALAFRKNFVHSGGFAAIVSFFSKTQIRDMSAIETRRGNGVALKILMVCIFGIDGVAPGQDSVIPADDLGVDLQSLSKTQGLLETLASMVVDDAGAPSATVMEVLRFFRLLFTTSDAAANFMSLPRDLSKRLVTSLLVKDDQQSTESGRFSSSLVKSTKQVRSAASGLILQTPLLADGCLSWLLEAIEKIDITSEATLELFNTLQKLISDSEATARSRPPSEDELRRLAFIACKKISECPRPVSEADLVDMTTEVLCGCLKLLLVLVGKGSGALLSQGIDLLLSSLSVTRWSVEVSQPTVDDAAMLDLMGVIFIGLLTPSDTASVAICCNKESRREGFQVIAAIAENCNDGLGYAALVRKINALIEACAPQLRHRWGEFVGGPDTAIQSSRVAPYSGLRNQGCTCYMNSALQQLFMMPQLRDSMCSAQLPSSLRSSGSSTSKGAELVGRKISVQWDTGNSYEALVEAYDEKTGMHTIRYDPIQVATVGGHNQHQQVRPEHVESLPPMLPDELFLAEGRPGKETGVFEVLQKSSIGPSEAKEKAGDGVEQMQDGEVKENDDQASSRHLLEEVQRTFIHLAEGSKGRCFDPRALAEACACLKLEFDVWQQNDASEFVTKLLDRLEASLKKWAPSNFKYLDHTFALKQTRQKICKECGLVTNTEEKLINIDCQIRGKSDIHEALATFTKSEVMEGSNKVSCERCKRKTDTILRTAVSTLPNMLILSLKRFDLDFNTFETVKLNSRCAFGQTLNMKPYTIEGIEAMEAAEVKQADGPSPMDTENEETSPYAAIPDDDYEYKLAGVLVHAGVAQGGHYYSFIRDRTSEGEEKWYRFDDEDVTPFNPASIETECFGGKVKKETKWPNGQMHTVEQEQFANALMLFYEKVKPTSVDQSEDGSDQKDKGKMELLTSDGYDVFKPDVQRTNATHKLQSFLFDAECQAFLKNIAGKCRQRSLEGTVASPEDWQGSLLQMILSYFFDVLLYSADRPSVVKWSDMLQETLSLDKYGAQTFVHKLAKKTSEVSGNWLRTYLVECPEKSTRDASVKIFTSALSSCAAVDRERALLKLWSSSFREMIAAIFKRPQDGRQLIFDLPAVLSNESKGLEKLENISSGEASSIGIILSQANVLLDYIHRCFRFSVEVCSLIRDLAAAKTGEEFVLREAMVAALIPARIIAFMCREKSEEAIASAFPGAAISAGVADTQIRTESSPHHVMPIGNNNMMATDNKRNRGPLQEDMTVMLEALACLGGLPGFPQATLSQEARDGRALDRVVLTNPVVSALTVIFKDHCKDSPGMSQNSIELYLKKNNVDANMFSPQKITELMSKFPAVTEDPSGGVTRNPSFLSLNGFLAYYQDLIQNQEGRVFHDLNRAGFRPNLTQRSKAARFVNVNGDVHTRHPFESIAVDVAESLDSAVDLGALADAGYGNAAFLRNAYDFHEPLADYLVAGSIFKKESKNLIIHILSQLHRAPNEWGGQLTVNWTIRALSVIVSVPDEFQEGRISLVMLCTTPVGSGVQYGIGLLNVLKFVFFKARQNPHDSWGFERYLNVLKELRKIASVFKWMAGHREEWKPLERELDNRAMGPYRGQRVVYGQRDGEGQVAYPAEMVTVDNSHTDSDMAGNHSDDEDEDSQCDNVQYSQGRQSNRGPFQIKIEDAGMEQINGTYHQDGYFENACKYSKNGVWKGATYRFFIFQCNVSNNTRHWYISIVPTGGNPGTSSDIDFYTAPAGLEPSQIPPLRGWVKAQEGEEPLPNLTYVEQAEDGEEQNNDNTTWMATDDGDENTNDLHQDRHYHNA